MTQPTASNDSPQSYEELLWRLEEAEETIRAIRHGEIDALVVRPVQHEQIFTLGGDNEFLSGVHGDDGPWSGGAWRARRDPLRQQHPDRADRKASFPASGVAVRRRSSMKTTGAQIKSLLAAAEASNDAASSCEISLKDREEDRYYLASAEPLQTGVVNGWAVTLTDLTDRVRAEKSVAAERAARAIIASANEAVVVCDVEGAITHANAAVQAIAEGDILGRPFHEAIQLTFSDTTGTRPDCGTRPDGDQRQRRPGS